NSQEIILESVAKSLTTSISRDEAGNALNMIQGDTRFAFSNTSNALKSPSITASAWIKPSLTGNTGWGTVFSGIGGSSANSINSLRWKVLVNHNTLGEIRLETNNGYTFAYTMIPDNWYYVTAVFTEQGSELFVNGIRIGNKVTGLPLAAAKNVERIQVGAGTSNSSELFMGIIDEVRIWNYAQVAAEITANKFVELAGDEAGLVAYYKYNHQASSAAFNTVVAVDSSSRYNHQRVDLKQASADVETQNGWVASYALGTPEAKIPSNTTFSSFVANFDASSAIKDNRTKPNSYTLQVSKSEAFTNIVTDNRTLSGDLDSYSTLIDRLVATAAESNGLLEGTNYYYRVRYELTPGVFRTSETIQATTQFAGAGNGLWYSGDSQYVDLGSKAVLKGDQLSEFTVMLWVKPRIIDENTDELTIANENLSGMIGCSGNASDGATTISFVGPTLAVINNTDLVYGSNATNQTLSDWTIKDVFTHPRWYHIAMTLSGSKLSVYVDGKEVVSRTDANMPNAANYINYLGRFSNSNDYCYYGGMDEFRVYKRGLSQQEIVSDAFRPVVPHDIYDESSVKDLVYYLQFNQASGSVINSTNMPDQQAYQATLKGTDTTNLPTWIPIRADQVVIDGNTYCFDVPTTYVKMNTDFASPGQTNFASTIFVSGEGYSAKSGVAPTGTAGGEYILSGLDIRPNDTPNKFYTTTAGLTSSMVSTQLLKQAVHVKHNLPLDGTLTIEFNLFDISPAIYNPDYRGEDYSGLNSVEKLQIRERFLNATADEFQLLWSSGAVENSGDRYIDLSDQGVVVEKGPLDNQPVVRDSNNRDDYTIRFINVPAWVVDGGVHYSTGVFTLGTSIPLDDVILTPALGLESNVTINGDGTALISWSVSEEAGVREYIIERQNSDGTWSQIAVLVPNGKSIYEFLDENYQDGNLYRIVVIDIYGSKQVFAANSDEQTWYITVNEGWNLLSLPCVNVDVKELVKVADGYFWQWNTITNSYDLIDSAPEGLKGFWIFNDGKERIIEISGKTLKSSQRVVTMERGWNIYGPAENCYIPENIDSVYSWNTDESYQQILSDKKILMATRAYWFFNLEENLEVELGQK
ncbi:MAG: LamG domain-containing protein, partial [Lentisphaeria bacterium]